MKYLWGTDNRYNDFRNYCNQRFGGRAQKVSINAGFTCPNRDGSKGTGGCSFCNNSTFNPDYCDPKLTITDQINKGIEFFKKYKSETFLAYFQAYSNTYGDTDHIMRLYNEALAHPMISGIVIGTRPDCISEELLEKLAEINEKNYVAIELGVESCYNDTLKTINRGHTWQCSMNAIEHIASLRIPVGVHMIMGLPGETKGMMLEEANMLSELPITFLKLHQLQIVRGSALGNNYKAESNDIHIWNADEYVDFCIDFAELLNPNIVIERFISQAPRELVIAPFWDIKNFEFVHKIVKRFEQRDTHQGRIYQQRITQI